MKLAKKLIALGLTMIGIGVATRKPSKKLLVEETSSLLSEESQRLNKPLSGHRLNSELCLLTRDELLLFNQYVKAVIRRDKEKAMEVGFILQRVPTFCRPFWHEMKGIIF